MASTALVKGVCSASLNFGKRRNLRKGSQVSGYQGEFYPLGDFCTHSTVDSYESQVPRICNLRDFSENEVDYQSLSVLKKSDNDRKLFQLLLASMESTSQVKAFETLSGRLAMVSVLCP